MRRVATFPLLLSALTVVAFVTGCNHSPSTTTGDSTVQGSVSDGSGTQPQQLSLGGTGTVAAATQVRLSSVGSGGALSTVATASLSSSASYSFSVPTGQRQLVVQALDASGNVKASGIVETTGDAAGQTITVAPIDTETSVEAQVFLSMVGKGTAASDINTVDVRARINQNVAVAVNAAASADVQAHIDALADALLAEQATQVKIYAQDSVNVSQNDLFEAELPAAVALDTALAASSTTAYADLTTAIDAALTAKGVNAKARAQAEEGGDVAFGGTLQIRLGAADAVTDASLRAIAVIEAHVMSTSVQAILTAGAANSTATSGSATAATSLETSVTGATTAADSETAIGGYVATMTNTNVFFPLGALNEVTPSNQSTLDASVSATASAGGVLSEALNAAVGVSVQATGTIDYNALATAVATAYGVLNTALQTQVAALSVFGADAQVTVDVLVVVRGVPAGA